MRLRVRHVSTLLASAALVAASLTVTAGAASAVGAAPTEVDGYGLNYGYELDWAAPVSTVDLVSYTAKVYLASDAAHTTPLSTQVLPLASVDPDFPSAEFYSLTPGTSYVGGVFATYTDGDTAEVFGAADQAYKPVGKVGSLKAAQGNKQLALTWKAPATDALTGSIFAYFIDYKAAGGAGQLAIAFSPKYTLKNLKNGTKYTITVTPLAGDFGPDASVSATPIGAPAKPTNLKAAAKVGGKTKLTWRAPSSPASAPVTGYQIFVNGKYKTTVKGKTHTYVTLTKQKKGTTYTYSVKAMNSVGKSKAVSTAKKKRTIS